MTVVNSAGNTPTSSDEARYRANYLPEQEGVYLYRNLADIQSDPHLAELYRRIEEIEQRHADLWKGYLEAAGEPLTTYAPSWRIRALLWISKRLGMGRCCPQSPLWEGMLSMRMMTSPRR